MFCCEVSTVLRAPECRTIIPFLFLGEHGDESVMKHIDVLFEENPRSVSRDLAEPCREVRKYFDQEVRKHPSCLLGNISPSNFLLPSETHARKLLGDYDNGACILEVGCGDCVDSLTLAGRHNRVWAIDISERRLSDGRQNVIAAGKADQVFPLCMDATRLAFSDNTFDLIVGNSVLLFLDIEVFAPECYRVLKPGGRAIFPNESMALHPLMKLRRALPQVSARERIARRITIDSINRMSRHFDGVMHREFYLWSVLLAPLAARYGSTRFGATAVHFAHTFDDFLLRIVPRFRKYCWISVLEFHKAASPPLPRS